MALRHGSKGPDVTRLQHGLELLHLYTAGVDGDFGDKTELAVAKFQTMEHLADDGVVGRLTAAAFDRAMQNANHPEWCLGMPPTPASAPPAAPPSPGAHTHSWARCTADKPDGYDGYTSLWLRDDIANAFDALAAQVRAAGGVVTTSGGRRDLTATVTPGRSATSMHYTGRAFDLALSSGMQHPNQDPFVVTREPGSPRLWRVYARSSSSAVASVTVDAVVAATTAGAAGPSTRLTTVPVTARLLDFTALASAHGFSRIPCRSKFPDHATYESAEWWHFQYTGDLTPHVSTFGDELLKVWSLADLQRDFKVWNESRDEVFGEGWN